MKNMRNFAIIIIFVLTGAAAGAQNYNALNGPFGGGADKIVNLTNGRLLAFKRGAGVFKSDDAGGTWVQSNAGLTDLYIMDLFVSAAGKAFVLNQDRLYSSIDNGDTWSLTSNSGFSNARFLRQGPSGNLFIASDQGNRVYRSATGASWVERYQFYIGGTSVTDFEILGDGTLVISTYGQGIFKSGENDLSATNIRVAHGLSGDFIMDLVKNGTDIYALCADGPNRSTNSAANFTRVASASMPCCFYSEQMAADPAGSVYVTNGGLVWKTTNNGTSWTSFASPLPTGASGTFKSFHFTSTSIAYLAISGVSIFKTTNGGTNWNTANSGFTGFVIDNLQFTDNSRLIATRREGFGLYITLDDGATWDFLGTGNLARLINGTKKVGSTIYAYGYGIVKSSDNGGNWTVVHNGSSTPNLYTFHNLATNDGVTMYTVDTYDYATSQYNYGMWKSTNSGSTFTRTAITGMPATTVSNIYDHRNIFVDNAGNLFILIYAGSGGELYKVNTTTGAATKVTTFSATSVYDTDYRAGKIYAPLDNWRLMISSDAAATWTQKTITGSYGNVKSIDDNTIYLLTNSINLSTDGGASWFSTGTLSTTNTSYVQDIVVSSANYSYATGAYSVVYKSKSQVVPPIAPTALSLLANGPNGVALQWNDNSNNETSFLVEASPVDNVHYDTAAVVIRPDYFTRAEGFAYITDLTPGTKYYFRVRSVGSGGKSSPTNEVNITLPSDCTASSTIPLNRSWTVSSLNQSGTNVTPVLNQAVTASGEGPGYLHIEDLSIGVGAAAPTLNPQPYEPIGGFLVDNCGAVYLSSDDFGGSEWIPNGPATWDAVTKKITIPIKTGPQYPLRQETVVYTLNATDPIPVAPTDVSAGVYTANTFLVAWTTSLFANTYEVERSTNPSTGFVKIATVDNLAYTYNDTDPTLLAGTSYYYRIRALNASGASPYSAVAGVGSSPSPLFDYFNSLPAKTYFTSATGGAWGDVDGDGIEDLVIGASADSLQQPMAPVVFKSKGDGQFSRYAIPALQNENTGDYRNVCIVDVNNDGRNDLFFTRVGTKDFLLLKNADGSYTKKIAPYPILTGIGNSMWVDFDNDGDVDLAVAIDVANAPDVLLYKNDGQGNLTAFTGSEIVTASNGYTRDLEWADYDNDGLLDVLKLNRSAGGKTTLYRNAGGGDLKAVIGSAFESVRGGQRTASWGDYNNDGFLDVFMGSQQVALPDQLNRLFKNNGDGTFSEVSGAITEQTPTYGSGWGDIDNDGDLDLLITADGGNRVYINNGALGFTKSLSNELFTNPNLGKLYGISFADIDNNGFLDFYNGGFSGQNIPNFVYRNTASASSSRNWLKVKLTTTISNRSAVGARIRLVHDGKVQTRVVQSHTSYGTQSSLTQHFGLGTSTTAALTIYWPSGNTQTMTVSNVNTTVIIPEDITPPVFSAFTPASSSTPSAVTKLEITLNEETVTVADKKIIVAKTSTPAVPLYSLLATAGVKDGLKYSYTLPARLDPLTAYQVSIEAGAFTDIYGNASAASPASAWTFTTAEDPDSGPPVITYTHNSIQSLEKGFTSKTVSIQVTDDKGVTGVTFHHRKIGSAAFESTPLGVNPTSFDVLSNMADDMGMEYYLEAKDAVNNVGRSPSTDGVYYRSVISYTGSNRPTIQVPAQGSEASWKIIAIPYELVSTQTSQIFQELGPSDKNSWRLLIYDKPASGPRWIAYPEITNIERGKGYFINSLLSSKTITLSDPKSPSYTRESPFLMDLVQGWNQIGNPYTVSLNWNDVRNFSSANATVSELYLYTNGQYVKNPELLKETGGFVFAAQAVNDLPISFPGQTSGRIKRVDFGPLDSESWKVDMILSSDGFSAPTGGVGMSPDASNSYDQHDDINPPRFTNYLEMNFDHPEFFYKIFGRDVVKTTDEYTWEFDVETNLTGVVTLTWDNSTFGDNGKELYLYDIGSQTPLDMRSANTYSFDPARGRRFRVYYGEGVFSKIMPEKALLGAAFPNPVSHITTIPFSLPEKSGSFAVRLEIFDMLGRKVQTLLQGEMKPGFYKADWQPVEQANSNGFYIYRLTVEGEAGISLAGKILLKR